jgi:hypothetical protein
MNNKSITKPLIMDDKMIYYGKYAVRTVGQIIVFR